jgi:glycosyltransferase involved in cell wall biosynthesis
LKARFWRPQKNKSAPHFFIEQRTENSVEEHMKILLISNYRPDQQQSMLRYAEMLQHELSSRGWQAEIAYPPVVLGGFSFLRGPLKKWIGYIDKYLLAPAYLRRRVRHADIVHICDHSNAMYLQCAGTRPALITCHDLLAIQAARGAYAGVTIGLTGRMLQRWITSNLVRAKHVICVSKKTQQDLRRLAPQMNADTEVIYHTLNWKYSPATADAIATAKKNSGLEPETQYLLHVGGNQWYKNRLGAMKIFAALQQYPQFQDVKFIMAGKPWTEEMRRYCDSAGLTAKMVERVSVTNEDLQALYSGAIALLFPSLEEGFGWPVLEAQACGCPVIVSDRAPMTEIAGEAAVYIDPEAPAESARRIASHISALPALSAGGIENAERFNAARMMASYQKFYEKVAAKMEAPDQRR